MGSMSEVNLQGLYEWLAVSPLNFDGRPQFDTGHPTHIPTDTDVSIDFREYLKSKKIL